MSRTFLIAALLFAVAAPTLNSCADDSRTPGSAVILWRPGPMTCQQAGVSSVDVELWRDGMLYDIQRQTCSLGKATFDAIPPGLYAVRLYGYPIYKEADGVELSRADATHEGFWDELEVREGQPSQPSQSILLTERKAAVYLSWRFSNGLFCAHNGVDSVEVAVYDEHVSQKYLQAFACDASDYMATLPLEEQGQPFRGIFIDRLDVENLTFEVVAFNADNQPTHKGKVDIGDFQHGETRDIYVTLESCNGFCN